MDRSRLTWGLGVAALLSAGGFCGSSSCAALDNPPEVPVLSKDGNLKPNIGLPPPPSAPPKIGQGGKVDYPPPPEPPAAPPGVTVQSYYSTCGGTHPPVKYASAYEKDYKQTEEDKAYNNSPEYQKFVRELNEYKAKYGKEPGSYQDVDPVTGKPLEGIRTTFGGFPAGSGIGTTDGLSGATVQKLDRDAKNDLAAWFRGFQYHDTVNPISTEGQAPELNASLEDPIAGPALTASHYAKLVGMLNEDAQKQAPSPKELVTSIEILWEGQWRRNLGFDADPSSKQLTADLERAMNDTLEARKRLEGLSKRSDASEAERFQLQEQRAFAMKEMDRCLARELPLRELFGQRMVFIRAIVNLMRLAPDGGFGPTFQETAEPKSVQASAQKILTQIGPLAAGPVWQGLVEDLAWLRQVKAGGEIRPDREIHDRAMAAAAGEAALCDTRLESLSVISDFLVSNRPAPAVVLVKALELLDKVGTKSLRPEALVTLPRVIALRKHEDAEVAERSKWVLLRLMGVSGGKASLEDAIGTLAPQLKDSDPQVGEAVLHFLNTNTGQRLPKDPQAWLDLQKRMIAEREKADAEKKKLSAK